MLPAYQLYLPLSRLDARVTFESVAAFRTDTTISLLMLHRRSDWPHPFLLLPILLGAAFTSFWSAFFFLGSEDTMNRMVASDGLLLLFAKRFLGYAILGGLLATSTGLLSWIGAVLGLGRDWARPRRVFWLTLGLQQTCGLIGCLVFTWAAYHATGES